MDLNGYFKNFWDYISENDIDIYNEFSFQHELGIYLRDNLPDYKVQFERNISFFEKNTENFVKKEIDISIYKCDNGNVHSCHAIELKYPQNGQEPDSMYAFVKDIKFMEQLKSARFDSTYCMVIVNSEDKRFYSEGQKNDGIYPYFRNKHEIHGKIYQQTGKGKNENYYYIHGHYTINWNCVNKKWMMYMIKTNNSN